MAAGEVTAIEPAREAIGSFLDTLPDAFISPAPDPLPPPSLEALRAEGIPTVDDAMLLASLQGQVRRRALLSGLMRSAGWREPAAFVAGGENGNACR